MKKDFEITSRKEGNIFYFELNGELDEKGVWDVVNNILFRDNGNSDIVLEGNGLQQVTPFARMLFRDVMTILPLQRIQFRNMSIVTNGSADDYSEPVSKTYDDRIFRQGRFRVFSSIR